MKPEHNKNQKYVISPVRSGHFTSRTVQFIIPADGFSTWGNQACGDSGEENMRKLSSITSYNEYKVLYLNNLWTYSLLNTA